MIAVSACLAGKNCRYDGKSKTDDEIAALVERGEAILICPEVMGGMDTPRRPSEIQGTAEDVLMGRASIKNDAGEDVTEQFVRGANEALDKCKSCGVKTAILKARSPSCGLGEVYDGTFSGKLKEGDGVTALLLKMNGIEVFAK